MTALGRTRAGREHNPRPRVRGDRPDSEAEAFLKGCERHFERSLAGDQLSPVRTSDQCWCSHNECDRDPLVSSVAARISDMVRTPVRYSEVGGMQTDKVGPTPPRLRR